jgi:hypothetical protein
MHDALALLLEIVEIVQRHRLERLLGLGVLLLGLLLRLLLGLLLRLLLFLLGHGCGLLS